MKKKEFRWFVMNEEIAVLLKYMGYYIRNDGDGKLTIELRCSRQSIADYIHRRIIEIQKNNELPPMLRKLSALSEEKAEKLERCVKPDDDDDDDGGDAEHKAGER